MAPGKALNDTPTLLGDGSYTFDMSSPGNITHLGFPTPGITHPASEIGLCGLLRLVDRKSI
jgi:hypothetical protein